MSAPVTVPIIELAEPFFICLLASMIWAPIVLATAARFQRKDSYADKLWPLALLIAALPALAAPFAAALGLSLRAAPPPMIAGPAPTVEIMLPVTAETMAPAHVSTVTLASVFEAAAALYLYGFLMFLALGIARHIWFSYRIGYAVEIDHPRLEAVFEGWRRRIGVRRRPRYAFTDVVSSVCVHGYFRPVVLMPEALLDRVSENDAALMVAHEMAHIKRGDTALFALCTAVKAVFWFNPFMQRIAAQANLAAEQAADALVIASGAERRRYARCFVEGLRFAAGARFGERELVPSFTPFDRRSRRERLDAILSGRAASGLDLRARLGVAASIAAAAGLAFAQAAFAVTPAPEDALTQAPVEGEAVKAFSQQRSVDLGDTSKGHSGVDIAASRGSIVRAAGDGKVVDATNRYRGQAAWGNVVVIDHGHGLVTRYAHLDRYKVKKGDAVKAGQPIGRVGSTGRTNGRPHLHFEVIQNGTPIDPAPVIAAKPMKAPKPLAAPAPVIDPAKEASRFAEVAPGPGVKIINDRAGLKPPLPEAVRQAPPAPPDIFEFMNFSVAGGEISELLGAGAGRKDLELKLRAFDANDIQILAMNLSEDAQRAVNENVRIAAETVKRNAETARANADIARQQAAKARAAAEREIERALEQAARNHERAEREREIAEEKRKQALERAERARERAEFERERIRERAEREREHAQRERERAEERAEKERERAEEIAEREMERAIDRFKRDWAAHGEDLERQKNILAMRERAIRNAQKHLDKQLAELERRRAELERAEEKGK